MLTPEHIDTLAAEARPSLNGQPECTAQCLEDPEDSGHAFSVPPRCPLFMESNKKVTELVTGSLPMI